jgi:hypothetical protein
MYPMTVKEFDHWVAILRENFPDHPLLGEMGTRWYAAGRLARLLSSFTALFPGRRKLDP